MYDVVSLGELLIDMTQMPNREGESICFEAAPGGAPANALAMLAKQKKKTAFIGKVGEDAFGIQLINTLKDLGIDTSGILTDSEVPTTLALIQLTTGGERSFSFYRNPGADVMLTSEEINREIIKNTRIFHFGSISMTHEPARNATLEAIQFAKENGAYISFDPNYRQALWKTEEDARREIHCGLRQCDILKISDDELSFLTGAVDWEQGIYMLEREYDIPIIFITMGAAGSICRYKAKTYLCRCDGRIKPVNTTGAGDTFFGAVLSRLIDKKLEEFKPQELLAAMKFGNTAAGLITTKHGALNVMPTEEEVISAMDYYAYDGEEWPE